MAHLKYLLFLLLIGCTPKSQNTNLYAITSKAKCKGPSGEYHTTLHATVDGYTRFIQNHPNRDTYDAICYGDTLGFALASDTIARWTERAERAVGKGHSFHMIAYQPNLVFNSSKGKYFDVLENEVKVEFDSNTNQVRSFRLTNPFDSLEHIDIFFSNWEQVQDIVLPMSVKIIQGGKDEFFFEFYDVKINDPEFLKVPVH